MQKVQQREVQQPQYQLPRKLVLKYTLSKTREMRDKNILPHLSERRNSNRKSFMRRKVLDSIPEMEDGSPRGENIPSTRGNAHLKEHDDEEFKHNEAEKKCRNLPTGIKLPKLDNTFSTAPGVNRGIRSPNASSFLNIANMSLSQRQNNDKSKRQNEIKCANYPLFEPVIADQVSAGIHLSRYAFRSSLERVPETDGEKLQSAHSKTKSNGAEKMKQDSTKKEKNIQMHSLKSVDLFDQQRQQLARKGPQIRVWFSYKHKYNRPDTPNSLTKRLVHDSHGKSRQVALNEELTFPRIILYQWEIHEKKPKLIKVPTSVKQQKKLPKLHRIPTASQEDQPNEDSNKDRHERFDSPLPKLPQAPPPTPLCQRRPTGSSENVPS